MRTLGRSNTIHFGYTEQSSPNREIKDKQIPEDEMLEDDYETGELRNITPNSYNNFGSNIIHRHTSGTILHNGKYAGPMQRSQSAAAAPSNFSNHRLGAFDEENWDLSFTTEFNMKPDITPTEDEKAQQQQKLIDHEQLRQKLGSHNIQSPDLLLCEKPVVKPSPSHIR